MAFPQDFVWGVAAASYQVEGAAKEDGRGLSVWDVFSETPGKTFQGDTGEVACDHYHRFRDDIDLMKQIGVHAYRLSVSWSRVLPDGIGKVNEAGLDYYDRLIDDMLDKDIVPYVTLFHWDYPWELYCRGGWLNRDSAEWFAEYTDVMSRTLGDRVKHWMTLNEPPVFVGLGHESGQHAPGDRWSDRHLARVMHHVLLAHGRSVQVLRANTAKDSHIGLAINNDPAIPVVEDAATIAAARQMQWTIVRPNLIWNGATWLDPMLKGSYPDGVLQLWGNLLPIQAGDMETIAQPLDFIGLNIYQGYYASVKADGTPTPVQEHPGHPRTNMDWKVTPGALYWSPKYMYERYGLPIYITENGLGSMDWVSVDGAVHDTGRIDFMHRYLAEFKRAGADGVPIAGYFHWSVLDNYEWAEGYRKRFGMIYVDYVTQQRILKDSALWYREVIASNGAAL